MLTVDSRAFAHNGKGWMFFPVALAQGFHRLKLTGDLAGKIDMRFGQAGASSLGPKNAWHVRAPGEAAPAPKAPPAKKGK